MKPQEILNAAVAKIATVTFANGYAIEIARVTKVLNDEPSGTETYPTIREAYVTNGDAQMTHIAAPSTYEVKVPILVIADFVIAQDSASEGTLIAAMNLTGREIARALQYIGSGLQQAIEIESINHRIADGSNIGTVSVFANVEFEDSLTAS